MDMRSPKPYSNVTFTKRVDHEAGRHRGPRAPAEPLVCTVCGASYIKRRWIAPESPRALSIGNDDSASHVLCPPCRQRQSGPPCGFVRLDGPFLTTHLDDIERLLRNESERAAADNPTARIMTWDRARTGALELTTTTPHLAQRLGHALEKAFSGVVHYDFSHENQVARVTWRRD
jgi:hypothetical protein